MSTKPMARTPSPELSREALTLVAGRFRVLGEPMRLEMLQALSRGDHTVSELAERLDTTAPNVSKHLRLLEEAGFVKRRPRGNSVVCSLRDETAFRLCAFVCESLRGQLLATVDLLPPRGRRPRSR